MIKITGMWELSWNTPIKEIDIWEMVLLDFKIDEFWMCPVSGIRNSLVTQEKEKMEDVFSDERNKGLTRVFIDEKGEIDLRDFEHPEDCMYVFGRGNYSPFHHLSEGDLSVRIETFANLGLLYSHQAASIVLYDRLVKNGSYNNR